MKYNENRFKNLSVFRHVIKMRYNFSYTPNEDKRKMSNTQDTSATALLKQSLTCFDSEQLNDVVKGVDFEIHQLDKGSFQADLSSIPIGKGMIDRGYYSRTTLTEGTLSKENMILTFINQTQDEGSINGEAVKEHTILMGYENASVDLVLAPHTQWTAFQFKREDLFKPGISLHKDANAVYSLHHQKYNVLNQHFNEIFKHLENINSDLRSSINTEMLYNHLLSLYAQTIDHTRDITTPKQKEAAFLAKKIYHYFQKHAGDPIQMIDITRLVNKSERTVERIFKKYFGVTPYTYLKLHRLHLVRKKLMSKENTSTVNITHIAMENGFMQMGYFGSEYKKLFNETPSQTLRRE